MSLRTSFTEELKIAMRDKNQPRVDAIRLVIAKMKEQDIAARTANPANTDGINDEQLLSMLQSMIKSRRESIDMYEKAGRSELAAKEQAEIDVIQTFLPEQLDEAATRDAIKAAVASTGATSVKDMGKVMAELKGKYAGSIDFTKASGLVKEILSAAA